MTTRKLKMLALNGIWMIQIVLMLNLVYSRHGATQSSISTIKQAIGPVADCAGPLVDLGTEIKNCYAKCEGYNEPKSGVRISILKNTAEGPMVVRCSKVRLRQEFIQTWTFSTIAKDMVREPLPVLPGECDAIIRSQCPDHKCDIRAPNALKEEYHFASSTTVTSDVFELHSAQGLLFLEDGKEMISPLGSSLKFEAAAGSGSGPTSIYRWKSVEGMKECPYSEIGYYGCDEFDEGDELFYACSGGGITITPLKTKSLVHSSICPGVQISEEGLLYSKAEPTKDSRTGHLAINVLPETVETEDAAYMRHKIQQVAMKLGSDICYTQCEVLSLETRISNKTSHLLRIGHEHYLSHRNGTATYCKPLTGCKLPNPITFCGEPARVGLVCNSVTRLWNPLKPYVVSDKDCPKPKEVEELTFSLGTSLYNVDNQLEVNLPINNFHGVYNSEFFRYHNHRMLFKIEDLQSMKQDWENSKSINRVTAPSSETNTSVNAPHISIGSWLVGIVSGVTSAIKSIEAVVGVIVILLLVGASVSIIMKIIGILRGGSFQDKYRKVEREETHGSEMKGVGQPPTWT